MPNTYTIRTLADLAQIPRDRLEACLAEVPEWLVYREAALAMQQDGLAETIEGFHEFIWVDDGLGQAVIDIEVGDKTYRSISPLGRA